MALLALGLLAVWTGEGFAQPASPYHLLTSRLPKGVPPTSLYLCLPPRVIGLLGVGPVAARDAALLRETVAELEAGDEIEAEAIALTSLILEAAATDAATSRRSLLFELLRAAGEQSDPEQRACAFLEHARLALRARQAVDGRSSAQRARTALDALSDVAPLEAAADYYLAEAAYQLVSLAEPEARDDLIKRFAAIPAADPSFQAAAQLRLRELEAIAAPSAESFADFEAAVLALHGERGGGSAPQLAEVAFAAEDPDAALRWLLRLELPGLSAEERAAVAIRRADALILARRRSEAAELLRSVAGGLADSPPGQLAGVRLVEYGFFAIEDKRGRALIEAASRSISPRVARNARSVAAQRLIEREQWDEALELLMRLSFDSPDPVTTPRLQANLRRTLDHFVGTQRDEGLGCEALLERLGGRRTRLFSLSEESGYLERIADCYSEVGLNEPALDTYRGMTRRFGPKVAKKIALPTARAYLSTGSVDTARASAEANVREREEARDQWRLLLAEIEYFEGNFERAADQLTQVTLSKLSKPDLDRLLLVLARSVMRLREPEAYGRKLEEALDRRRGSSEERAEAAFVLGHLHRLSGKERKSLTFYRYAAAELEGSLRARALYWIGRLSTDDLEQDRVMAEAALGASEDLWSEAARTESRLGPLRAAVGRTRQ